jgi:hypothetical protein
MTLNPLPMFSGTSFVALSHGKVSKYDWIMGEKMNTLTDLSGHLHRGRVGLSGEVQSET